MRSDRSTSERIITRLNVTQRIQGVLSHRLPSVHLCTDLGISNRSGRILSAHHSSVQHASRLIESQRSPRSPSGPDSSFRVGSSLSKRVRSNPRCSDPFAAVVSHRIKSASRLLRTHQIRSTRIFSQPNPAIIPSTMSASHHEFSPAPGVDLSQAQAEAVGLELVRLQAKHGPDLRPADIVHAAADLRSPLHAFFTWENAKAADAWRRVEATRLVRSVTVRVTEGGSVREAPITLRLAEGDPDVRPPAPPVVLKIATPRQAYTLRDPVEAMIEDLRGFAVYYDRHHDDLPDAIRAALEEVRQAVEAALAAVSTRRAA